MTFTIAYSSEGTRQIANQLGSAHYSYRFIEDAMIKLLKRAGYKTIAINNPEYFKGTKAYASLLGADVKNVVHLCFRSSENIRILHGAKNICNFAWEFEVMKHSNLLYESILLNQVHMLNLMDEIWVGCEFTRDVLQKYGLKNTFVIPAPIVDDRIPERMTSAEAVTCLRDIPCLPLSLKAGASRDWNADWIFDKIVPLSETAALQVLTSAKRQHLFITILNPGDLRKNLINLIEGFQIANSASEAPSFLIVKLAVNSKGDFRSNGLFDHLVQLTGNCAAYNDPNVIIILDYITNSQIDALLSMSNYYLCASHCEGYNRPLLQSMAVGTVPVTTYNTAMLDYISTENAIVIAEMRFPCPIKGMAADVARRKYSVDFASRFDVAVACRRAMDLHESQYSNLSKNSQQTVSRIYSEGRVLELIERRLNA